MKIGFIGQGWIGRNYANDFEARDFDVVRYSLESTYIVNKNKISECEIVFIAVPTPTTPKGFDYSAVKNVLPLVGRDKIAIIKSTVLPGTTEKLQKMFPDIYILHSPEFLVERTAAHDAANPNRNIIGIPIDNDVFRDKAKKVMKVLPDAPYKRIMSARDAEFVKYAGNCFLYSKVIFMNLLHDLVSESGSSWTAVREAMIHDPRIGSSHTEPIHSSGRGAGGHCFIKDFEALRRMYNEHVSDDIGMKLLDVMRDKNNQLLIESGKDTEILESVYGKSCQITAN